MLSTENPCLTVRSAAWTALISSAQDRADVQADKAEADAAKARAAAEALAAARKAENAAATATGQIKAGYEASAAAALSASAAADWNPGQGGAVDYRFHRSGNMVVLTKKDGAELGTTVWSYRQFVGRRLTAVDVGGEASVRLGFDGREILVESVMDEVRVTFD